MRQKNPEYEFHIDAYTPQTIPLDRLAKYMDQLATLLGENKSVHFVKVKKGSCCLVASIEREAEPKVKRRIANAQCGDDRDEGTRAIRKINQLLIEDNGSAKFLDPAKSNVLDFPGATRYCEPQFGPFNQAGSVDGMVIRVGGETKMVPVHLEDRGQIHICEASRNIARDIAKHIFGPIIRADGMGRWFRDMDGEWKLRNFKISSFTVLEDIPLDESRLRLHRIKTGLNELENPSETIRRIREA